MTERQVFADATAAQLLVDNGTVKLRLLGILIPVAPDQPGPLPTEEAVQSGTFAPLWFDLTPTMPATLRVMLAVAGTGQPNLALTVAIGKRSAEGGWPLALGGPPTEQGPLRFARPDQVTIPLSVAPGHVDVQISARNAILELSKSELPGRAVHTVRLIAGAGSAVTVHFNLFFQPAGSGPCIGIPLAPPSGAAFAFTFTSTLEDAAEAPLFSWNEGGTANGRFTLLESAAGWSMPAVLQQESREIVGFANRALLRTIQGFTSTIATIKLASPALTFENGELRVGALAATVTFAEDGRSLKLSGPGFRLDSEFILRTVGQPQLAFTLDRDELLFQGGDTLPPLSIQFAKGATVILSLDPRDPYIALGAAGGKPPVSMFVPGLKKADITFDPESQRITITDTALRQRFVLRVDGDNPGGNPGRSLCRITPHGAQMTATAEPHAMRFGIDDHAVLRDIQLEQGTLTIDRGDYDLDITASARLGYFEHASGRLSVRASSRIGAQEFAATFEVQIEGAWEDPTGSLEIHDPGASVAITLAAAPAATSEPPTSATSIWEIKVFASGTLRIKGVNRLAAGAAEWLGDLAKEFAIRFDRLALHDFLSDPTRFITLPMQSASGRRLTLWKLLRFELTELRLARDALLLGGSIHLSFEGGFYIAGSLPHLRLSLTGGIDIVEPDGQPMTITGKLVTPTGIQAELELTRERTAARDRLAGHGTLLIPGWPGFRITCGFGKRRPEPTRDQWIPTLFLFVEADFPITIFPCVVLRDLGLGFGINQALRGFDQLWADDKAFATLMNDPRGLPNPATPGDWEDAGTVGATQVALVARTHVAPSPDGRGPFPYVADAMLYVQPTGDFTIAFTSNLWLFTGLDDVRAPDYRRAPLAQALMVLYPRHGHLEARARTLRDSKMKAAPDAVAKALDAIEAEIQLKATPDMFRLRVGPLQVQLAEAGFDLHGSLYYAVESGGGVALMLMQQQMSGSFLLEKHFGLSLGPLNIEVDLKLHARMAYSLLLAGGYFDAELGLMFYGLARVHISVALEVSLAMRFHLRIRIGWFNVSISWSQRQAASLSIAFEADIEAMLGTRGMALRGSGTLEFKCCGYSFSPSIDFATGRTDALDQARNRLKPLLPSTQSLPT